MSWRVPVVAAIVLGVFGALAFYYYKHYVKKRNYGIIVFVVNGLDSDLLHRARLQTQVARSRENLNATAPGMLAASPADRALLSGNLFHLESMPHLAMLSVQGPGDDVADAGASATALACGARVPNGMTGCDAMGKPLKSLLAVAQEKGRATGLITTGPLTAPSALAFYGHSKGKPDPHEAASQLATANLDIVMGGGGQDFEPIGVTNEAGRLDRRDIAAEMKGNGYTLISTTDELNKVGAWRTRKVLGIFSQDQMLYEGTADRHPEQPSLADMTRRAIEIFNYTLNGYVLVIEHDLVKRASERNFTGLAIDEALAFDEALRVAREYAGPDALIVVTNGYSLGAQAESLQPLQPRELIGEFLDPSQTAATDEKEDAKKKSAAKKKDGEEEPEPSTLPPPELIEVPVWLTGPGAVPVTGAQQAWLETRLADGQLQPLETDPRFPGLAARFSRRAMPTAEPAWMATGGLFSEKFSGFMPNTQPYHLLIQQF